MCERVRYSELKMAFQKNQKRKRESSPNQSKKTTKKYQKTSPKKANVLDLDSGDEKGLECTIVSRSANVRPGFVRQLNQHDGDKTDADQMWVNKYKPKSVAKIVGQNGAQSSASKLRMWLDNWYKNKDFKPSFYGKNETGAGLKAALLSGPPGIGRC